MTQILFTVNEQITALRLNQATQGYKFLRRTTYAGSAGSTVGNAIFFATTWNIGSGTAALYVRVCGAGGGSWGARAGVPANTSGVSAGAGGGGYSEKWILSSFGSSQVVEVGLGGTRGISGAAAFSGGQSRFGTQLSAGGGVPGATAWNLNGTGQVFAGGGAGGVGSGGSINAAGIAGGIGFILATNAPLSGRGGQSAFGGPGGAETLGAGSGQQGTPGGLYGGGGGGASIANAPSLSSLDGGNGSPGFVIVDEYA